MSRYIVTPTLATPASIESASRTEYSPEPCIHARLFNQRASIGLLDPVLHGCLKRLVFGDRHADQNVVGQLLGRLASRRSELCKLRFFFASKGHIHLFNLEAQTEGVNGSAACWGTAFGFSVIQACPAVSTRRGDAGRVGSGEHVAENLRVLANASVARDDGHELWGFAQQLHGGEVDCVERTNGLDWKGTTGSCQD
jgi:hypothetical protein